MYMLTVLFVVLGLISALPMLYGLYVSGKLENARFVVPEALEPKVYDLWRKTVRNSRKLLSQWICLVATLIAYHVAADAPVSIEAMLAVPVLAFTAAVFCADWPARFRSIRRVFSEYASVTGGRDLDEDDLVITGLPAARALPTAAPDRPRLNA